MMANRLHLNPTKTEALWCSSSGRQHQIPAGPTRVGSTSVLPVSVVRGLGASTSMLTSSWVPTCNCQGLFRSTAADVRRSLTQDALLTLIHALVTKLDVCCSALAGVSGSLILWLHSVLNAAARLVFSATQLHSSVNSTGWKFWREFSFSVCSGASMSSWHRGTIPGWVIVVFMARRHHTWLSHCT